MLRSPLSAFSEYSMTTAGIVVAVATSLWLVAVVAASMILIDDAAGGWWQRFSPVVYLEAGVEAEEVAALRDEMQGWSTVEDVEVEQPAVALSRLRDYLGDDEIRQMGVSEEMMPTALVIRPRIWRPDQADLMARVQALGVRDVVVGVDSPQVADLAWMARGRIVAAFVAMAAILILLSSFVALGAFLRRLQERERGENHLLEIFGAPPGALRRPTLWRGLVLGAAAGTLAGLAFLPWSMAANEFVAVVAGQGALPPLRSAIWAATMIPLGLGAGAVTGWFCGRPRPRRTPGKMEALLDWETEGT